jgi:LytR cell envelope-related transcriptional attenuator
VLLMVATAIAAGAAWLLHDDPETAVAAPQRPSCPPTRTPAAVVAAHDVRVNVYNATKRHGLATQVAQQLRQRGFVVAKVENDPAGRTVIGIAQVRASASGPARTVGAQVASFVAVADQRKDASVDLVLGADFRSLRTAAAAAAALSPSPSPRPSGC